LVIPFSQSQVRKGTGFVPDTDLPSDDEEEEEEEVGGQCWEGTLSETGFHAVQSPAHEFFFHERF